MLSDFSKPAFSLGDLYFADSLREVDEDADNRRHPHPRASGVSPWIGLLRPSFFPRFRIPRVDIAPDVLRDELTEFVNQCRDGAASLGTRDVSREPDADSLPPE